MSGRACKACFKGKSLKTIILILSCPFIWVKLYPFIENTFQLGKSWRPFQLKHLKKKKRCMSTCLHDRILQHQKCSLSLLMQPMKHLINKLMTCKWLFCGRLISKCTHLHHLHFHCSTCAVWSHMACEIWADDANGQKNAYFFIFHQRFHYRQSLTYESLFLGYHYI